jgi:serine/threonine protein kinase
MHAVANEQGGSEEIRWTALTEQATAWSTTRFAASDAVILEENKLQNRCALCMFVYKLIQHDPSFQKKICPVILGVPACLDRHYCAPEVANQEPRNTSLDIWSIGVVFLEMTAVLKGRMVEYVYNFLKEHGSKQGYVCTNSTGTLTLITKLKETGSPTDNAALGWVQDMVMLPLLRPTTASLMGSIISAGWAGEGHEAFCGICCASPNNLSDFDELETASTRRVYHATGQ